MDRTKNPKKRLKKLKGRMQSVLVAFCGLVSWERLVLFQFAIIIIIPFILRGYATSFYILLEISALIAIIALTNDKHNDAYKFSWMCVILIFRFPG